MKRRTFLQFLGLSPAAVALPTPAAEIKNSAERAFREVIAPTQALGNGLAFTASCTVTTTHLESIGKFSDGITFYFSK